MELVYIITLDGKVIAVCANDKIARKYIKSSGHQNLVIEEWEVRSA